MVLTPENFTHLFSVEINTLSKHDFIIDFRSYENKTRKINSGFCRLNILRLSKTSNIFEVYFPLNHNYLLFLNLYGSVLNHLVKVNFEPNFLMNFSIYANIKKKIIYSNNFLLRWLRLPGAFNINPRNIIYLPDFFRDPSESFFRNKMQCESKKLLRNLSKKNLKTFNEFYEDQEEIELSEEDGNNFSRCLLNSNQEFSSDRKYIISQRSVTHQREILDHYSNNSSNLKAFYNYSLLKKVLHRLINKNIIDNLADKVYFLYDSEKFIEKAMGSQLINTMENALEDDYESEQEFAEWHMNNAIYDSDFLVNISDSMSDSDDDEIREEPYVSEVDVGEKEGCKKKLIKRAIDTGIDMLKKLSISQLIKEVSSINQILVYEKIKKKIDQLKSKLKKKFEIFEKLIKNLNIVKRLALKINNDIISPNIKFIDKNSSIQSWFQKVQHAYKLIKDDFDKSVVNNLKNSFQKNYYILKKDVLKFKVAILKNNWPQVIKTKIKGSIYESRLIVNNILQSKVIKKIKNKSYTAICHNKILFSKFITKLKNSARIRRLKRIIFKYKKRIERLSSILVDKFSDIILTKELPFEHNLTRTGEIIVEQDLFDFKFAAFQNPEFLDTRSLRYYDDCDYPYIGSIERNTNFRLMEFDLLEKLNYLVWKREVSMVDKLFSKSVKSEYKLYEYFDSFDFNIAAEHKIFSLDKKNMETCFLDFFDEEEYLQNQSPKGLEMIDGYILKSTFNPFYRIPLEINIEVDYNAGISVDLTLSFHTWKRLSSNVISSINGEILKTISFDGIFYCLSQTLLISNEKESEKDITTVYSSYTQAKKWINSYTLHLCEEHNLLDIVEYSIVFNHVVLNSYNKIFSHDLKGFFNTENYILNKPILLETMIEFDKRDDPFIHFNVELNLFIEKDNEDAWGIMNWLDETELDFIFFTSSNSCVFSIIFLSFYDIISHFFTEEQYLLKVENYLKKIIDNNKKNCANTIPWHYYYKLVRCWEHLSIDNKTEAIEELREYFEKLAHNFPSTFFAHFNSISSFVIHNLVEPLKIIRPIYEILRLNCYFEFGCLNIFNKTLFLNNELDDILKTLKNNEENEIYKFYNSIYGSVLLVKSCTYSIKNRNYISNIIDIKAKTCFYDDIPQNCSIECKSRSTDVPRSITDFIDWGFEKPDLRTYLKITTTQMTTDFKNFKTSFDEYSVYLTQPEKRIVESNKGEKFLVYGSFPVDIVDYSRPKNIFKDLGINLAPDPPKNDEFKIFYPKKTFIINGLVISSKHTDIEDDALRLTSKSRSKIIVYSKFRHFIIRPFFLAYKLIQYSVTEASQKICGKVRNFRSNNNHNSSKEHVD